MRTSRTAGTKSGERIRKGTKAGDGGVRVRVRVRVRQEARARGRSRRKAVGSRQQGGGE